MMIVMSALTQIEFFFWFLHLSSSGRLRFKCYLCYPTFHFFFCSMWTVQMDIILLTTDLARTFVDNVKMVHLMMLWFFIIVSHHSRW